jgi:hypothetical protein
LVSDGDDIDSDDEDDDGLSPVEVADAKGAKLQTSSRAALKTRKMPNGTSSNR